ncbi:MAG: HisA/HisF-related TIM barrel protein, partial [Deltaproteobacteria bacterium]|nr:HisA/HisF-related TIM barrel protein [Deltaproteobacteria bacterium]
NHKNMDRLSQYCSEFLIHGVDVEGKQEGVEEDLITILGQWDKHPITYAGGVNSLKDIKFIKESGRDHVDFTVGSALDIFGGKGLRYKDLIDNQKTNFVNLSIEVPP